MYLDVLPLRAVIFQFLFLLVAISLEAAVFYRTLNLDYKTSVQYAVTVNLLSTFVGWLLFFNVQPLLSQDLRAQLISYVFFEQFFPNPFLASVPPILIILGFSIFIGTFLLKLVGLDLLEILLEKDRSPKQEVTEISRHRRSRNQVFGIRYNSRAYAVMVANALSFTAILFLLFVRLVEQTYITTQ